MAPPERGGPDKPDRQGQEPRPADQNPPETSTARKGGRHRKHPHRPTAAQVAEFVKCAPALIRIADEVGQHKAPIGEWIHTLMGAALQVLDALHGWWS